MSIKRKIDIDSLPHYTVEDWKEWEGEWELIDGIPHAMAPMPTVRHQVISGNTYRHFANLLDNCGDCSVYLPINLRVDDFTVLHPDLSIACGQSEDSVFLIQFQRWSWKSYHHRPLSRIGIRSPKLTPN
ncbi:MAG: Uma2 family endonuclease [Bacteroidetes bacterium]|nr:Uma2 family endonuclease [Bacteroidota bacterium]